MKPYTCSVKDCFNFENQTTSFGLKNSTLMYRCNTDATVVKLLKNSNYRLIGTPGTSFCTGTLSKIGVHKNGLYPGASSCGSALDVDYDRSDVSVCTDTFGSCIFPAGRVNCYGFKPSYGRISRYGVAPLCSHLDTVSIMSKDFTHVQKVFKVLDVYDHKDDNSVRTKDRCHDETTTKLKLKVPLNYFRSEDMDRLKLRHPDLEVVDTKVTPVELAYMLKGFYWYLMTPDFYSNIARFDGYHHKNQTDVISEYNVNKIIKDRTENINCEQKSRLLLGRALAIKNLTYFYESRIYSFLERLFDEHCVWVLPIALNLKSNTEDEILNVSTVANVLKRPIVNVPTELENGLTYMSGKNTDLILLNYVKSLTANV